MRSNRLLSSHVLRMVTAAALFWIVGCKAGGAPAGAAAPSPSPVVKASPAAKVAPGVNAAPAARSAQPQAPASQDDKKTSHFKLQVKSPTLNVGAKGAASVSIAALNGYKWNKEYPAKLLFKTPPKHVKLGKTQFKQMAGDFKVGDKTTSIPVSMQANVVGTEKVKGLLKFSICNATACIIEKADVVLAITVQP